MPKTTIAKGEWKDFFHYNKWVYLLIGVIVWMLADLLFSATEYHAPNERRVVFQVVSQTVDPEGRLLAVAEEALRVGQEFDETLEEVSFYTIGYDPDNDSDGYGGQKYMLMLGVGEGDVYIVSRQLMRNLVDQDFAVPLEGYIATGVLDPGDVDLSGVTFYEPDSAEGRDPEATHVYAIPMTNMNAMLESDVNFDNRDAYMVLMNFSANPDTCAKVMSSVIEQLTAPLPEWAANLAATQTEEGTNVFDAALQDAGFATAAPAGEP